MRGCIGPGGESDRGGCEFSVWVLGFRGSVVTTELLGLVTTREIPFLVFVGAYSQLVRERQASSAIRMLLLIQVLHSVIQFALSDPCLSNCYC